MSPLPACPFVLCFLWHLPVSAVSFPSSPCLLCRFTKVRAWQTEMVLSAHFHGTALAGVSCYAGVSCSAENLIPSWYRPERDAQIQWVQSRCLLSDQCMAPGKTCLYCCNPKQALVPLNWYTWTQTDIPICCLLDTLLSLQSNALHTKTLKQEPNHRVWLIRRQTKRGVMRWIWSRWFI